VKGQFMLGHDYLVAPVLAKDGQKIIKLPKGIWKDDKGSIFKGPLTLTQQVGLERLPVYQLINKK
jgi:alpha-glucosidase